ncbi:hypothetical protein KFE25_007999 [Diacronema lutheri]|uniref:RING-type E3 ubiquitin transferase n=2 Tax=Diacronema lutheri TaxID=2081491 RepID=A0A8J5XRK1_DIALT|nr:hypothetical protein KFE25_007999 [Diacronema lutheri]
MLGGRERASSCSVCLQTDVDTQTERIDVFECNICLDSAQEPVVTFCGHLFCWPCIYRWLEVSAEPVCPVCKAPVSPRRLIPVYGRGKPHFDPRVSPLGGVAPADARIPNRPHSRRPDAHRRGLAAALQPEAHAELPTLGGTTSASLLPPAWTSGVAPLGLGGLGPGFGLHLPFGLQLISQVSSSSLLTAGASDGRTAEQLQHAFLSRLLLLLGSFFILCLLLF